MLVLMFLILTSNKDINNVQYNLGAKRISLMNPKHTSDTVIHICSTHYVYMERNILFVDHILNKILFWLWFLHELLIGSSVGFSFICHSHNTRCSLTWEWNTVLHMSGWRSQLKTTSDTLTHIHVDKGKEKHAFFSTALTSLSTDLHSWIKYSVSNSYKHQNGNVLFRIRSIVFHVNRVTVLPQNGSMYFHRCSCCSFPRLVCVSSGCSCGWVCVGLHALGSRTCLVQGERSEQDAVQHQQLSQWEHTGEEILQGV